MPYLEELEQSEEDPLYKQVYLRFRRAIANGSLPPGARVPSIRSLASELKLSRNTIEMAYDLLIGEGYLVTRGQGGTIVAPYLNPHLVKSVLAEQRQVSVAVAPLHPATAEPSPFQLGLPAMDSFPYRLWSTLHVRRLRLLGPSAMTHPDSAGFRRLREAISGHLQISRGLRCTPEQVYVTSGYRGAIRLIADALLQPGDTVWVEDPCFPPTRDLFGKFNARQVPVPVDADGMDVAAGIGLAPNAKFVVVTPAHQSPLGAILPLTRRLELLDWAKRSDAWIIEDDYDSEYRYDGPPLPAMSSLDAGGRILYIGTFSKVLYPSLRLGYLVVSEELVPTFNRVCAHLRDSCPTLTQAVVADFISTGHLARHVKKMRRLYAERRLTVIEGLRAIFGERLRFAPPAGGLQLLARLAPHDDDAALAAAARKHGFAIEPLSTRYIAAPPTPGLLFGFANIAGKAEASRLAKQLRAAIDG